jgi:hypothetical protein
MTATTATIELVPLGRIVFELSDPLVLADTPAGTRMIFEVESGRFEGERIQASAKGKANADWFLVGPEGTGTLDVRCLLETDDGALVLVQYHGRVDLSDPGTTYSAPRFETGDERYHWLNRIQAVGKGSLEGSTLTYDLFELR